MYQTEATSYPQRYTREINAIKWTVLTQNLIPGSASTIIECPILSNFKAVADVPEYGGLALRTPKTQLVDVQRLGVQAQCRQNSSLMCQNRVFKLNVLKTYLNDVPK